MYKLPIFNDAHIHIWKVGDLLTYMLDLRGVTSLAEMQAKLADFAQKKPKNEWILARGFNEALFADGRMPDRHDIDKIISDRPVHIIRTCAHIVVLNTFAMQRIGIQQDTVAPAGGEIRKDAHGNLTGVITETALGLAKAHLPPPTAAAYRQMILAAQDAFLKVGIGAATDPAVHPELLEVYHTMAAAGELKVRINAIPIMVPDGAKVALPLPKRFESPFLKVVAVKCFADGGLSGKTAAVRHGYKNTSEKGVMRLEADFFKEIALKAQNAGFQLATHAIGDATIEMVLNVYESIAKYNSTHLRHRLEHVGLPDLSHLIRMRELGIHAVSQPVFLYELGQNYRRYLPDFYLENVFPYRSILDAGINLAFSSDAPVIRDFSPLLGMQTALERIDNQGFIIGKHQRITIVEAIHAYTQGAALASQQPINVKTDYVILDKNPMDVPVSELGNLKVLETWVNGKLQFKKDLKN
jgi:predicted amidohydrolase YtcJ